MAEPSVRKSNKTPNALRVSFIVHLIVSFEQKTISTTRVILDRLISTFLHDIESTKKLKQMFRPWHNMSRPQRSVHAL